MTRRMAVRQPDHDRRERWLLVAQGVVEGVVLVACLLALCALVVAFFVALAPSGASLPGVTG